MFVFTNIFKCSILDCKDHIFCIPSDFFLAVFRLSVLFLSRSLSSAQQLRSSPHDFARWQNYWRICSVTFVRCTRVISSSLQTASGTAALRNNWPVNRPVGSRSPWSLVFPAQQQARFTLWLAPHRGAVTSRDVLTTTAKRSNWCVREN